MIPIPLIVSLYFVMVVVALGAVSGCIAGLCFGGWRRLEGRKLTTSAALGSVGFVTGILVSSWASQQGTWLNGWPTTWRAWIGDRGLGLSVLLTVVLVGIQKLWSAPLRQPRTFRKGWIVAFIVVVAVAIEVAGEVNGWPIIRTAGYRVLVDKYERATAITAIPMGGQRFEWTFVHSLSGGNTVRIQARDFMDVVKVHYGDERRPHNLYRYVDYSSPIALRTDGDILYVYWSETLIHNERWLLAYDLASHREIERRRVDALDIGGRN